jgi:NAD(P)-dependent dehydrogenase (short-subunit alcohol dehydrogenase family)
MEWTPDPTALARRIAVVAGATRGAGRGIAAALGEAGATVICTGRSSASGSGKSDYDRPETIEETADLVSELGDHGIPVQVDHLEAGQVRALADRVRRDAHGHELEAFGAVAVTPGWLRSEMMLDNWGVSEGNWRAALAQNRADGYPTAPPAFVESETPRYVGRGVAAIAADETRARWNQQSVSSAQLAREYGFTDLDGRRPDGWA